MHTHEPRDADFLLKLGRRMHHSITPAERAHMERQGDPDRDFLCLSLPPAGEGHNAGLMRLANLLLNHFDVPYEDAFDHMRTEYERDDADIHRALRNATQPGHGTKNPKFPNANTSLIEAALSHTGQRALDLQWESPGDCAPSAFDVVKALMQAHDGHDPLVCIGSSKEKFRTDPLSEFEATIADNPYIVPQPMCARMGRTQKGRMSEKTNENTGDRINLVLESDKHSKETQTQILQFLNEYVPLLAVCDSGGKSLHGFFDVAGHDEAEQERFFRIACLLGADKQMWTRSQFARIPGGTRPPTMGENGSLAKPACPQTLLYFAPDARGSYWRIQDLEEWMASHLSHIHEEQAPLMFSGLLSAADLCTMEIPPRKKVLGDFFCEGDLGFIYAPRGLGKTWLTNGLARAITTGGSIGEWNVSHSRRVLIVDGEMNLAATQERLRLLDSNSPHLHLLHHEVLFNKTEGKVSLNLADASQQKDLSALVRQLRVEVLFLDNLSCLFRGVAENEADAWEAVLPWLLDLRRAGVAVVVIAHAGRNGLMRGTSRREDSAHWVLSLENARDDAGDFGGTRFIARFTKNRNSVASASPPMLWEFVSSPEGMLVKSCSQTDLSVMLELIQNGLDSATDLARELDKTKGTISKWAKRLQSEGKIVIRDGKYKSA